MVKLIIPCDSGVDVPPGERHYIACPHDVPIDPPFELLLASEGIRAFAFEPDEWEQVGSLMILKHGPVGRTDVFGFRVRNITSEPKRFRAVLAGVEPGSTN